MPLEALRARAARASRWAYPSSLSTWVRLARVAAIASGLPLNVPTCSYLPSAIADITSSMPPIAATEMPPPRALARQTMSGVTPYLPVAPAGPVVKPVLTSSKVR